MTAFAIVLGVLAVLELLLPPLPDHKRGRYP